MLWWPIIQAGTRSASLNAFLQLGISGVTGKGLKLKPKNVLLAFGLGAGYIVGKNVATIAWQNWLKRQLLYQMYLFSGTRLYRDIYWMSTTGSRISMGAGVYAGAAIAGGALGAAAGIGISKAVFGDSGEQSARDFYSGKVSWKEYKTAMATLWDYLSERTPEKVESYHGQTYDHAPQEFNYSFGGTSQAPPSTSQDFPLGLGPGGIVV